MPIVDNDNEIEVKAPFLTIEVAHATGSLWRPTATRDFRSDAMSYAYDDLCSINSNKPAQLRWAASS
jgi:hypothetical protein